MAESPGHKLGQIIGEVLEEAIEPLLKRFAGKHYLYLDEKGPRGVRKGSKVTWTDANGNSHDLDFVLERNGSDSKQGTPVAFIETAWRRYTKHSRNKAQELQGAVLPLCETYRHVGPFVGAILAGVFTDGALSQLKSLGFTVLYFPYDTVLRAFGRAGVDISFDEETTDRELSRKVTEWKALGPKVQTSVARTLLKSNKEQVDQFMEALERAVTRRIQAVRILPLFGTVTECTSIREAMAFIEKYDEQACDRQSLARYEIQVIYANSDRIEGRFADKENALKFLVAFVPSSQVDGAV
jgi:hypothetical protein